VPVGLFGLSRSGVTGEGRSGRVDTVLAMIGAAVLGVAELASIPIADQRMDATAASLVGAGFGLDTLLSAVGFLLAGVATVRAKRWDGWRKYTPLATRILLAILIGLVMTPALAAGVGAYGLSLFALGIALATQPAPTAPRPLSEHFRSRPSSMPRSQLSRGACR